MSLFNRLVFNSPYRVKLSYRTASPPKTSYRTASPPRTSWVSGSVFSRLILPPARPESFALANSTVPISLFNGVELSSGRTASCAGPPASPRSELAEMNPVVPDIKFSSSVDGHVKKKTKQMDITAAEAEALIPFYLEGTVRESTKKQYRSYFISLTFLPSGHLEVKVEQAKNFENWDSQCSYVAKNTEGNFDPLAIITPYFNFLAQNNSNWLFPNFRLTKAKKIKILDVHVIYSNMLQSSLTKIGLEGKFFSLHSIRTGSLSEAANSEKVSKSDLQRHTRWKSSMVSYYHKLSLEKKLSVTKSLKLYSFQII